jgi:hypothetical protein
MRNAVVGALVNALVVAGCAAVPAEPQYGAAEGAATSGVDATPLSGRWVGVYSCGQGPTGLALELSGDPAGVVEGVFRFHAVSENPGLPSGAFRVRGHLDGGRRVVLQATEADWIERPGATWRVVSVEAALAPSGSHLLARIPACGSQLELTRQ